MPNPVFLDTLVKLASLGTSGICIFAIFWTGWLLYRPPRHVTPQWVNLVRYFITATIVIALISAASGTLNAYFNAMTIVQLQGKNISLSTKLTATSTERDEQKRRGDQLDSERKDLSGKLVSVSDRLTQESLRAKGLEDRLKVQERHLATAAQEIETLLKSEAGQAVFRDPRTRKATEALEATLKGIHVAKGHHP